MLERGNAPAAGAPPKVPYPKAVQTLRFLVRPGPFMERCRTDLGETFHASVYGPGELVFVSDPDSLKKLFAADRVNTIAPGRNIILGPLLGPGSLLLQDGAEHLRRRKLMLPPFHGERMRAYQEVITAATERAMAGWPTDEPFPLHPSMQAITLEVILRAVFGVEDERRRDELSECLVAILAATATPRAIGFVIPGVRSAPGYRRLARLSDRIDELLAEEITERRADPGVEEREDILSMLVAARFEDGSRMEDAELRDQLMTLLLAGHETTATALAWTFDLLFHRPDALERLTEEVRDGGGGDSGERRKAREHVGPSGESSYLDAVIEESLRVRPVVPFTGRELREPAELGGYELDAGTVVMAAILLTHTREDIYPRAREFRPERFLEADTETYSWIPFGGGTRRCIGAAFAQFEMRVALETILRSCDLRSGAAKPERPIRRNVTMSPADGSVAVLERRR